MNFNEAVNLLLEFEGGYVDHPNDPGGITKFGISQKSYPHLDIQNLSQEEAKEIYKQDYWNKLRLDELPSFIRFSLFDCAVNQGLKFSIRSIQSIVGVKVDGVLGIQTMSAILECKNLKQIHDDFILRRLENYASQKNWKYFGVGWVRRLLKVALAI